jgi:hypothetical protein
MGISHFWRWITSGQNATALGVVLATLVNLFAVIVLIRTLFAVNRQARASDRQAQAAEEQAKAARKQTEVSEQQRIAAERAADAAEEQVRGAKSATAVSEAQRIAAEQAAAAQREHSELIRQQLRANLRPILIVAKRSDTHGNLEYIVANHGQGIALSVNANYRNPSHQSVAVTHDILGPNHEAPITLVWKSFEEAGLQIRYTSQDGRFFATTASANGLDFKQKTFEVDANGGDISPQGSTQNYPHD